MKTNQKRWSPKRFLAYVLLYAAHADIDYNEQEKEHIISKVGSNVYEETLEEFSQDNNYVQLQKILIHQIENDDYSPGQVLQEMNEICLSDNHFHRMEKYMLSKVRSLFNRTFLKSPFQQL